MPKLFVVSDIHSAYTLLKEALDNAGFEPENSNHLLVVCGDYFDRMDESQQTLDYLMSVPNKVLVKGNHEDLFEDLVHRKYPLSHDWSNCTAKTLMDLAPEAKDWDAVCSIAIEKVRPLFDQMVNYFETENYIFVHSFIALTNKDGLPMYYTRNRKFEFNTDWRYAHSSEWGEARWGNPFLLAEQGFLPDKTLVFGHWATEHKWAEVEGRKDFDDNAHFDIFYGDGYIGIDGCTAYSGKVNVLVIENENFLENPIDKP